MEFVAKPVLVSPPDQPLSVSTATLESSEPNLKPTTASEPECNHSTIGIKLAPYNPTNSEAVAIALDLLGIPEEDQNDPQVYPSPSTLGCPRLLYDLGCGDGRLLIEACRRNSCVQCVGVEYDGLLVERAQAAVLGAGYESRINIVHDNVVNVDLLTAHPTCLFIYLVPAAMKLLKDTLCTLLLSGDCLIVTYVFSIPGLVPSKTVLYKGSTKLYLYTQASTLSNLDEPIASAVKH